MFRIWQMNAIGIPVVNLTDQKRPRYGGVFILSTSAATSLYGEILALFQKSSLYSKY